MSRAVLEVSWLFLALYNLLWCPLLIDTKKCPLRKNRLETNFGVAHQIHEWPLVIYIWTHYYDVTSQSQLSARSSAQSKYSSGEQVQCTLTEWRQNISNLLHWVTDGVHAMKLSALANSRKISELWKLRILYKLLQTHTHTNIPITIWCHQIK
jgi:hypothetical protein